MPLEGLAATASSGTGPSAAQQEQNEAEKVTVNGVITGADDGQPLIGAYVIEDLGEGSKTASNGVITDIDGLFSIETVPGATLKFTCLGFQDVTFVVPDAGSAASGQGFSIEKGSDGRTVITFNLAMKSDAEILDDVVVIAYGVRKKGTVAGSVVTVKSDKVETTSSAAFDQALQGQVPGLTVLSNSGEPSATATMTIRGTNSINSGTAPLYILDGVAISSSDFNMINPADIESISVLKDASSTSIYGARAANGVIVITSKRGKSAERPQINFRTQLGVSQIARNNWNMMNTAERIQYEKEIGLTEGKDYNLLSKTDVNWLDKVFNDDALLQNYELSVAGANEKTNYYISGNYYNQQGTAVESLFERYALRANIEQRAAEWLKIGFSNTLNYQEIKQADEGVVSLVTPISAAQFMMPYWDPYRADGSLASIEDGSWKGDGQNPLEWIINNPITYKKYKMFTTLFAEAEPIKNLVAKSQFSIDFTHTTAAGFSYPEYSPNYGQGTAQRNSTDGLSLQITNTINYRFDAGTDHSFNFLLGQEGINYHYENFAVAVKGQQNNKLTDLTNGTYASSWSDTVADDYSYLSFFTRGEYNWGDRLYTDFSLRTDASSRFGKSGRWAAFWSVGSMWNIRNEDFMKGAQRWLTTAQIAVSTGTSGNSSIPNYEHLALVQGGLNYVGNVGMAPASQGNPDLGWEKLWTSNVALHLGFWNRLTADIEFYNKKTTGMLMYVPTLLANNGFGYRWDNVGAMVNRGFEVSLSGNVISREDFYWALNANVSYNRNKITELYNGGTEFELSNTSKKLVVGHDAGEFYINRYAGVNPANGDALWYTKDGELTNELKDSDKVMIGKSQYAPWQGGFGTSLGWKGLSLSAQFSWVGDRWMINNDRYFNESNGRFASYNQSARLLERWKNPGDVTDIPRHGVYTEFDSRLLEDASFLRLKNLQLGYSLPKQLLGRTNVITGARLYLQAQNLLTWTKFSGLDPESSSNIYVAQYPMARQYTFGLDITF